MDIKKLFGQLFSKDSKWNKAVIFAGFIGIALILLSSLLPKASGNQGSSSDQCTTTSSEEYVKQLEEKVQTLVEKISGVGSSNVMITLENGVENVYANSEKKSTDNTTDSSSSGTSKATDKNNTEQNVVVVDGKDGKQALVVTQKEPTVKGVVVVCDGGDNLTVVQDVTDAVTTALRITSNRVTVVKAASHS